jgi:hypothetical protein
MPDRFVHVHLSPDQDPLALEGDLIRWLEENYPGRVSSQDTVADTEVLIRIRFDALSGVASAALVPPGASGTEQVNSGRLWGIRSLPELRPRAAS